MDLPLSQMECDQLFNIHNDLLLRGQYKNKRKKIESKIGKVIKYHRDDQLYHHLDRIKCYDCGVEFQRSNACTHFKTKVHLAYAKINKNMKEFILRD